MRRAAGWARSALFWAGMAVLLTLLTPACGSSTEQRVGSGAAIGAGAGAAVGMASGTGIVGGVLVGAAAGGITGLVVDSETTNRVNAARGVVLRQHLQHQARLWDVSYPILTESAKVCRGSIRPNFGFVAWTRWDIERAYRIASMSVYGLDDRLRVVHVLPGSPAAAAGLRAGDEIEQVGWHDMPSGRTAGPALQLALQKESVAGVAQTFRVRRGTERLVLRFEPRIQCDVDLIVTDSDQINAFTRGRSIYVTDGLMRFFADDHELAAVVAHIVGHSLLGHEAHSGEDEVAEKLQTRWEELRLVFLAQDDQDELTRAGLWPGFRPFALEQEIQADRAALELMARTDYRLEALPEAWRRISRTRSGAVLLGDFHPPSEERDATIRDVLRQVDGEGDSGALAPGS